MNSVVWRVVFMCLLVVAGGSPVVAGAASATTCTFEYDVTASRSETTPGTGTVTSDGERGTSRCQGPVQGYATTGDGTAGFDGTVRPQKSADCRAGSGEGEGVQSLTLPTEGGDQHITNRLTYTYKAGSGGAIAGDFRGDQMSGTFEFKPIDGNCSTREVRTFRVTGRGKLHGR